MILRSTIRQNKKVWLMQTRGYLFSNVEEGKWKDEIYLSTKSASPVFCQQAAALSTNWRLFLVGRPDRLPSDKCPLVTSHTTFPDPKNFPRVWELTKEESHVAKKMKLNFKTAEKLFEGAQVQGNRCDLIKVPWFSSLWGLCFWRLWESSINF